MKWESYKDLNWHNENIEAHRTDKFQISSITRDQLRSTTEIEVPRSSRNFEAPRPTPICNISWCFVRFLSCQKSRICQTKYSERFEMKYKKKSLASRRSKYTTNESALQKEKICLEILFCPSVQFRLLCHYKEVYDRGFRPLKCIGNEDLKLETRAKSLTVKMSSWELTTRAVASRPETVMLAILGPEFVLICQSNRPQSLCLVANGEVKSEK